MMNTNNYVSHYFIVKVYDHRGALGNLIEMLKWDNMTFEMRMKYDWYFKYRAALLQVKYPKMYVEVLSGHEAAVGKTLEQIKKQKKSALKSKITKSKNILENFKAEFESFKSSYCSLFPIEEQIEYIKYVNSIELAKSKIKRMESELDML